VDEIKARACLCPGTKPKLDSLAWESFNEVVERENSTIPKKSASVNAGFFPFCALVFKEN
jgi:hypothetical protein